MNDVSEIGNVDFRDLGMRIRQQRIKMDWTQADLAKRIGVTGSFIGHIERAEKAPSLETVARLSVVLGATMDWLVFGIKKNAVAGRRRLNDSSANDEWLQLFHQIVTVVGVNLEGDRLGKIQAENAQNGLAIHDVTAYAKVDVIGIAIGNVYEGLDIFRQAQLDIHGFHRSRLLTH